MKENTIEELKEIEDRLFSIGHIIEPNFKNSALCESWNILYTYIEHKEKELKLKNE